MTIHLDAISVCRRGVTFHLFDKDAHKINTFKRKITQLELITTRDNNKTI